MVVRLLVMMCLIVVVSCSDEGVEDPNPIYGAKIISGPFDQYAVEGTSAYFSVSASGTNIQYQWFRGTEKIEGARGPVLEVDATVDNEGVRYTCSVDAGGDKVTSSSAMLNVVAFSGVERNGKMVRIPASEYGFSMGSASIQASGNESPVHKVTFTTDFLMDSVPVTKYEFETIMNAAYPECFYEMPWGNGSSSQPAVNVSWFDAVLYCNAISKSESLDTLYRYELLVHSEDTATNPFELNLSDSVMVYRIDSSKVDTFDVTIEGEYAIRAEDTVSTDTTSPDVGYKIVKQKIIPADTILIVPNGGFELREFRIREPRVEYSYDSLIGAVYDTLVLLDTVYELDTVLYKTYENDTVLLAEDTVIWSEDSIWDTVIVQVEEGTYYGVDSTVYDYSGYRLPSEAQWEFAARAYGGGPYFWGAVDSMSEYAVYRNNSGGALAEVASKKPNLFGLYDMSGNVWEWCNDVYDEYSEFDVVDPLGPATGDRRVKRGGSYNDIEIYLRTSQRGHASSSERSDKVGFRTVRLVLE